MIFGGNIGFVTSTLELSKAGWTRCLGGGWLLFGSAEEQEARRPGSRGVLLETGGMRRGGRGRVHGVVGGGYVQAEAALRRGREGKGEDEKRSERRNVACAKLFWMDCTRKKPATSSKYVDGWAGF